MALVLIIEDDGALRSRLGAHLTAQGYSVAEATDGKTGIECFRKLQPTLVLVDVLAPGVDGHEVICTLRRESARTRIIAMCDAGHQGASSASSLLRIARLLGAAHTLSKPFSMEQLDIAIEAVLGEADSPVFLVLDDDADARLINRRLLTKAFPGSQVMECSSITEALDATSASHPDAIITDHHLGQEDGIVFVEQLRQRGVRCPVLMVTGNSDPAVHRRAYAAGADKVFHGLRPDLAGYLREKLALG